MLRPRPHAPAGRRQDFERKARAVDVATTTARIRVGMRAVLA